MRVSCDKISPWLVRPLLIALSRILSQIRQQTLEADCPLSIKMASSERPLVFFVTPKSFEDLQQTIPHLLETIHQSADVIVPSGNAAFTPDVYGDMRVANVFFQDPRSKAIVFDCDIIQFGAELSSFFDAVVGFAKNGRTVICCKSFVGAVGGIRELNSFFDKTWLLPWKVCTFGSAIWTLNKSDGHGLAAKALPKVYPHQALTLRNVATQDMVYVRNEIGQLEDDTPVAFSKLEGGIGGFGYIGTMSFMEDTTDVITALMGLS